MENEEKSEPLFDVDDRVKRKEVEGCCGTVTEVRAEVTASTGDTSEKGLMVVVQWDNGTHSYFTPQSLEKVS